jgi:NDP-sugar pyrophosphorylase family protein
MAADLADATAAIFAGGLGTRLRSSVADRPKVLAGVRGRPFLEYLLDQLVEAGVRDVVLCTGYMGEQVEAAFGDRHGPLRVRYSREEAPLGTGGALRLAEPLFGAYPVLVLNGDSICVADLGAFRAWHEERGAEGSLLLTEVADTGRYGRVVVEDDGALASFEEKQAGGGAGWINAGVYLLGERIVRSIREIRADGAVSLEREVLPSWVGKKLYGYRAASHFIDIGTPASYAEAERFFADVSATRGRRGESRGL